MSASGASAWRLVAILTGLNVLAYVDRQMVAALAPVLMAEFGLTRAEIGLIVGPAFIVVFALGTLAVGAAADRLPRTRILALGLLAWSAATALSGTATGLGSLLIWRALVGIGEATLPPTAVSLLGDRFPAARLGLPTAIYYAGVPTGFALSLALAGWFVPRIGWRGGFAVLGIAGAVASASLWRLRDPRPARDGAPTGRSSEPVAARLRRAFAAAPALPLLILSATLMVYASASSQHLMTWLVQERGFEFSRAAYLAAAVILLAGVAASVGTGALTDAAERRVPGGRLLALAGIGTLAVAASVAFYRLPPASPFFLPCWVVAQGWTLGWYGPMVAAIHRLAPADARATVVGFALMTLNLLGVALGPWITGAVGDRAGLTTALLSSVAVSAVGIALVAVLGARERAAGR